MSTHTETTTRTETALETFNEEWHEWHDAHERHRAHPHGFLAVTHLHWLGSEATRLEGAPGTWSVDADVVRVVLEPGESLQRDGVELNTDPGKTLELGPIEERGGINLVSGDTVVEVAKRGGEYIVRPRNPSNTLLQEYRGTPAYAPNAAFAVAGRFVPFEAPRPTTVGAAVEGIQHVYEAPGEIRFKLAGKELALTAFNGYAPGSLSVLFTDQTSGKTTYAANRSLSVVPAADGSVQLDFNRAVNLPCAYTDLATCPLPPAENRLPVAVEAGEKIPYERQDQQ
ncbi:DUF1684 domain-containing protein [Paenarthrobacter aurescens]|uniref:DUF1684 domain-containing protein n=1 Tax=Paenarthrobacter aurescens TaxID=43663 RepID=A0A4Y3NG72_PAEAU|nr:DUF1684 domain-containing protein [Paenarthrobacter aurescens]MDO6145157.1 DUF1684 domain-containing protein [Paenarthrobacter aurescens]MDO6149002.1 DUF1684 domain-containing protein [Paenarthrobacter aurescens]MDO6160248.1 DUF1684 domain-containing protein [Paenarthrobacter aurescens]MDO6164107.1 DUF1684 domain-containing protein [Paenarthrobacter aurescens]GEB20263.1 hypothetical protein AAU01_30180 [Paenarthrobacter aurescens]